MEQLNVLKEYYIHYLQNVRKVKPITIKKYLSALNVVSGYLVEHGKINESIYEISELAELETIREFLFHQLDFVERDERGDRMYSASLNNYVRFASGTEYNKIGENVNQLDFVIPVSNLQTVMVERWKRNGIIKKQSIEWAMQHSQVNGHTF